jgi:hypothetical protein
MADEAPIDLPLEPPPASRHYVLLCLMMLLVITVQLVERVPDVLSLLPLVFGGVFLLVPWRDGPALVLLFVGWLLTAEGHYGIPRDVFHDLVTEEFRFFAGESRMIPVFDDLLLAAAFLVYAAGYYRYFGFVRHLFPLDPRHQPYAGLVYGERRRLVEEPQRRGPDTLTAWEFGLLALVVPLWIGGAAVLWNWMMEDQLRDYVFDDALWAVLKLMYLLGVPLLLFRAGIAYSMQCRAHRDESLVFLQDQLWRETRREQGRVNRWLTWARLRAQRREERT